MRRDTAVVFLLVLLLADGASAGEQTLCFGRFGTVAVYRPEAQPQHVVLFVSGDGGWNKGVVDMARELATVGALVVGIDIIRYLKELAAAPDSCLYPASDFEALSQSVQKNLDLPRYEVPVLVGYSSGATLVYAALVQAPPNTFLGAVSLGFCPDFPTTKPFCKGGGLEFEPRSKGKGVNFLPASSLTVSWVALQGTVDQVCDPEATATFVSHVPHGEIMMLPKVGHGFSVPRNWLAQFRESFERITRPVAGTGTGPAAPATPVAAAVPAPAGNVPGTTLDVSDLPLVELPANGTATDVLAVIVSGDGGWAGIDRQIGEALAGRGIAVVGLNSLQYFWKRKTPEIAGRDLERIVRHYLEAWGKSRVVLVGYSRGAEVLPFMADRLPAELRSRLQLVALLGPTAHVEFEFHVADWLGGKGGTNELPVAQEVEKLAGVRILCFYGQEEKDSLCPTLAPALATAVPLKGAHHFGGAYGRIADAIVSEARAGPP
jgi:type IV secretory pathway VirJ component